jgi:TM2 domain-containing membrane protein YozV
MPANAVTAASSKPLQSPIALIPLAWFIPGAGHFLLGRKGRGAIIFATVLVTFLAGVAMRGPLFHPVDTGDILSRLIQFGGYLGDLASGIFYFVASFMGYGPPDVAGYSPDYGSKFIVAAGLLNILAIVDAYEICTRQKD